MGDTTTPAWPCAFTRIRVSADEFISRFPCNHIHGVYIGDCVDDLVQVAQAAGYPISDF